MLTSPMAAHRVRWLLLCCGFACAIETDAEIKTRLFANYGPKSTRPGLSAPALAAYSSTCVYPPPDQIRIQAYVEKMIPLDTRQGTYGFEGYLRMWWTDPRLRFNGTADGGCTDKLSFSVEEEDLIWKPSLYWEGANKITMPDPQQGTGQLLHVSPDGSIWWSRQTSFLLSCPMSGNLGTLPFDTQVCTFLVGSYTDTSADTYLRWKEQRTGLANYDGACMAEWYATGFEQEDLELVYSSANFTYAKAKVTFSRSPGLMLEAYIIPAIILVLCSYFGFFIDPAATPARVSLSMLTIVVSANNVLGLIRVLPTTSEAVWVLSVVQGCLYFNCCAMLEVVIVSFGGLSKKWLKTQRDVLDKQQSWKHVLFEHSEQLAEMFAGWDTDNDNQISRKEFRRGVASLKVVAEKTDINRLFDDLDSDNDGYLAISEIRNIGIHAHKHGNHLSDEMAIQLEAMAEEAAAQEIDFDPEETLKALKADIPEMRSMPAVSRAAEGKLKSTTNKILPKLAPGDETDVAPGTPKATNSTVLTSQSRSEPSGRSLHKSSSMTVSRKSVRTPQQTQASSDIQGHYVEKALEDLDKGRLWSFKVFYLFPILQELQNLDHYARVLFPIAFAVFMLAKFGEVDMTSHYNLLRASKCYAS